MDHLDELLDAWQLRPDGRRRGSAQDVRTQDDRPAVLKLAAPTGWHAGSIPALKAWRTAGAVEVLRAAPAKGAVLLERLKPGSWWGEEELDALATVWRQLHVPAPSAVPGVGDLLGPVVARWTSGDRSHGLPPRLAQQAAIAAGRLLARASRPVLVHGQLHAEHVMLRTGQPVAISPLGFAGDAECEMAAAFELVNPSVPAVQEHFWALLDALVARGNEVDELRARDWTVVLSAARASTTTDRLRKTHLLTVAKAVGALEVGQPWE